MTRKSPGMQVCIQNCYLLAVNVKNKERCLVTVNISQNINKQYVNVIKVGFLCLMRARNVQPNTPTPPPPPRNPRSDLQTPAGRAA